MQMNSYRIQSRKDRTWPPLTTSTTTSPHLHYSVNDRSISLVPSMYSFKFMNVARLITLTKKKE